LNRLCEDGVLEKRENGYRILDRESLAEKATEFL
jgi:CRP/FNR family transcriptional regulator, putaive post-exponential-phase nitrogen-starvation regulator